MSRLETVQNNWTEITDRLLADKQELANFLRFSSKMYKQSFSDAALIYHQNPNATKVTTLETWNRLGRLVNRGEHSIAVFGEDSRAKHLFDISQTNGKKLPELWKLTEDLSSELTAVINKKYGKGCNNIQETIAAMSVDNIRANLSEMMVATGYLKLSNDDLKAYQQSVVSAVRFVVSNRCELDSDMKISGGLNLKAVDMFKDRRDLIRFCDLVQKCAKNTLLEMEREIVQIQNKRRERNNELQVKPDRTTPDRNTVHRRSGRTGTAQNTDRQVGQNVAGVGENRVPDGSDNLHNGGTVEHHSQGDQQGSGETLLGTGRDVSSGKSPSDDILGNSDMGEKSSADDRTSDNGRDSLSVEELIEQYKNADFNRRLDSYEIAGHMLYEVEYTEWQGGAIDFFNHFEADKYSAAQADEIRNIITSAIESRDRTEPFILNNFIVETSKLLPLVDENIINGILKDDRFFKIKRNEIARYFENNEDMAKRSDFMRNAINTEFSELDLDDVRVGYKADKTGLLMWEGSFLSRTREVLLSWDLVQSLTAAMIEKGEYLNVEVTAEIDEPIFAEPIKSKAVEIEPEQEVEQLSLFDDDYVTDTEPKSVSKNVPKRPAVFSNKAPDDEMVDYILKCGSNEPESLERIVAQFQKGKSIAEDADFLRREFGENGRGYMYVSQDSTNSAMLAAWFDKDGITAAISNTAFPQGENIHLDWEQAAMKVSSLLENGMYCTQDIIDRAAEYELRSIAKDIWNIHRDITKDYKGKFFISEDKLKGNAPDVVDNITFGIADKDTLQSYIDGMADFIKQCEENSDILTYRVHRPKELLNRLKELQIPRREFITKSDFAFSPKFFITEDEKDKLLMRGTGIDGGKFRIEKYYRGDHSTKEKADFLKKEYGTGGAYLTGFDEWHDAKGIKFQKGKSLSDPDCEVLMKWNEVAKRIDVLIAEGRYITQKDIDERIKSAKRDVGREIKGDYDRAIVEYAKKILEEYGISLENEPDKSPLEKIIEKAEAAGVPVEIIDEPAEEKAVFMDTRDETFIAVQQTDEGIDYSIYAPDLTLIDGGVWEMDNSMDLRTATAILLDTSENDLAEISDYDRFMELVDLGYENDVPAKLAKLKAEAIANMPSPTPVRKAEQSEQSTVNAPEKITVPEIKEPKSGVPVTYHFNSDDVVTGGAKSKFRANIEAIQTLQKIEAENRYATPEEQSIMAKYVGWGGIPQAFVSDRIAENIGGNLGEAAPSGWETEQQQLRELLTDDEYKAARASTLTSFYTPPEVADGVYQALSQFGFEGGNVLEPSMGVGNFFSKMPEEMRDNSRLYGVELDSISGRIAQQLYPNERIQIKGFEKTTFNNNSFDVVLGNIPFGDYGVSDKAYDKHNFKIHDYFAAKSVDKVKPNGVVALVTSKFTMDKQNEKARRYLAERCDLLGAVRLPNTAFKQNAGTEVTTDILFLKKRETMTVEVPDWVHMSETADGIPCNKYFVDNPDMVLGKMAWDERMKGKYGDDSKVTTCYANEETPLSEQIKAAISKIEGKIETVKEKTADKPDIEVIPADPSVRNFTHTLVDGKLFFRENEIMTKVQETGKTLDRMIGMHKIRQAAMAVIDAQAAICSDDELNKLQSELNAVYDKFKKSYGNITDSVNERCFRQDDDYNTLAALEIVDTEKKTVEKSELFYKRTFLPEIEITSVDTPQEALQVSIDRLGKVDIEYMSQIAGVSPEKLIADLGDEIFRNPAKIKDDVPYSGYEDASEYLSGNVREKLKIAQSYAKHIDSSFERNATALEKVIPKNLEANEISVRIGTNWIDVEDYNNFLRECAKADTFLHPVVRTRMGEYKIEGKTQDISVAATETYGTKRMNSYQIFENLLNQRDIVVRDVEYDDEGKKRYVPNVKETQLAKEKARQMKERFKSWIWEDIDRREKYVERYNNLFNAIRGREYDGSHQTFPGMNPAIKLRPHQKKLSCEANWEEIHYLPIVSVQENPLK